MIADFIKRQMHVNFRRVADEFARTIAGEITSGHKTSTLPGWGAIEGRDIVKDIADAKKKIEEYSLKPRVLIESDPVIEYPYEIMNKIKLDSSFDRGIMYASAICDITVPTCCPKCSGIIKQNGVNKRRDGGVEIAELGFSCTNCKIEWVDTYKLELLKRHT